MIKINLIEKKKRKQLPQILGVDLNQINWKFLVVAILLLYVPGWYIKPIFEEERKSIETELNKLRKEISKVQKKINENKDVKKKLEDFNRQITRLENRSKQVQKIINQKTNPKRLLESIARKAPSDLWFNSLKITSKDTIEIKGGSESYQSIGSFISSSKNSPFFDESLVLSGSKTETREFNSTSVRVETFTIRGGIVTYNPFGGKR